MVDNEDPMKAILSFYPHADTLTHLYPINVHSVASTARLILQVGTTTVFNFGFLLGAPSEMSFF